MNITKAQLRNLRPGTGIGVEKRDGTRYAGKVVRLARATRAQGDRVVIERVANQGQVTVELVDIASAMLLDWQAEQAQHESR